MMQESLCWVKDEFETVSVLDGGWMVWMSRVLGDLGGRFDGVIIVLCLLVVRGAKGKYCYGNRS
jgi:hypothetical protein